MGYSDAHVGITVSQCAHNGVIIMAINEFKKAGR